MPGDNDGTRYSPLLSAVVPRVTPVSTLLTLMFTFGSKPPLGSLTVPIIAPVDTWAFSRGGATHAIATTARTHATIPLQMFFMPPSFLTGHCFRKCFGGPRHCPRVTLFHLGLVSALATFLKSSGTKKVTRSFRTLSMA